MTTYSEAANSLLPQQARQESLAIARAQRGRSIDTAGHTKGRSDFRRGPSRPGRNRTCNPRFWRPVLYQLSYGPMSVAGGTYRIRGRRGRLGQVPSSITITTRGSNPNARATRAAPPKGQTLPSRLRGSSLCG